MKDELVGLGWWSYFGHYRLLQKYGNLNLSSQDLDKLNLQMELL